MDPLLYFPSNFITDKEKQLTIPTGRMSACRVVELTGGPPWGFRVTGGRGSQHHLKVLFDLSEALNITSRYFLTSPQLVNEYASLKNCQRFSSFWLVSAPYLFNPNVATTLIYHTQVLSNLLNSTSTNSTHSFVDAKPDQILKELII